MAAPNLHLYLQMSDYVGSTMGLWTLYKIEAILAPNHIPNAQES